MVITWPHRKLFWGEVLIALAKTGCLGSLPWHHLNWACPRWQYAWIKGLQDYLFVSLLTYLFICTLKSYWSELFLVVIREWTDIKWKIKIRTHQHNEWGDYSPVNGLLLKYEDQYNSKLFVHLPQLCLSRVVVRGCGKPWLLWSPVEKSTVKN